MGASEKCGRSLRLPVPTRFFFFFFAHSNVFRSPPLSERQGFFKALSRYMHLSLDAYRKESLDRNYLDRGSGNASPDVNTFHGETCFICDQTKHVSPNVDTA